MDQSSRNADQETIDPFKSRALFPGLVFNQQGEPAQVANLGGVDHYVIDDDGFKHHVVAHVVDDEVLEHFQNQVSAVKGDVVKVMLDMMGQDDIFTKTALDSSVDNLADSIRRADPAQWVTMLGLSGFRIIVDHHGEVVDIHQPNVGDD